ncbi:MAG TPA: LPS assembly lipoprotein LptE [Terriglobales bacterium]|nr:LPS assembly lipoprotein LptE [Terriglobales bacterium]
MKLAAALILATVILTGCGYHTTSSKHNALPQVKTLAIPAFINQTHSYRVEQVLTTAIVRELTTRTQFRIVHEEDPDADATLKGIVVQTQTAPVTYDSATGRVSTALVAVNMRVSLVGKNGTILFDNPNYVFREQYQISRELSSFFDEETPALDRLARDVARSLVSNILEGF